MDGIYFFMLVVSIPILFWFGLKHTYGQGILHIGFTCLVLATTLAFAVLVMSYSADDISVQSTESTDYTYSAMIRTGPTMLSDYDWKTQSGTTRFVEDDDAFIGSADTVRTVTYLAGTGVNFTSTQLDTGGGWAEEIHSRLTANTTITSMQVRGTIDDGITDAGTVCTWEVYLRGPGSGSTIEEHAVKSRVGPTAFNVTFHDFTSLRSYFVIGIQSDFADPFSRGPSQEWTNSYCNVWDSDDGSTYYNQNTNQPVGAVQYTATQSIVVTAVDITIREPTPAGAVAPATPVVLSELKTSETVLFVFSDDVRAVFHAVFLGFFIVGIMTILYAVMITLEGKLSFRKRGGDE